MSGQVELALWFREDQYRALAAVLAGQGTTIEHRMQDRFQELYEKLVPLEARQMIEQRIDAERAVQAAEDEAARVFSVFHVTEHGREEYFQLERKLELLDAARSLRRYLRQEPGAAADSFSDLFPKREPVTAERFDQLVSLRMENTGKVAGAFELDFDKREFSAVNIMDGWKTYAMADVSAAAYHAFRKDGLPVERQWERLLEKLDGKEITSAGHLSARNVSFAEEICELNDRLNFYMEVIFDADTLFDSYICTMEDRDWINVYANYDMASGQVCDELDIELHRGDGSEEELTYPLNAAEKDVLLQKMDDYCRQREGRSLQEYRRQLMAEDMAPPTGPVL